MSANTDGWVAFGLSGDNMMSGDEFDDVIACQAESGGAVVNAKDMNNPSGEKVNSLDSVSPQHMHTLRNFHDRYYSPTSHEGLIMILG